ncbi:MAG: protein MltB [Desulfobacteraceae bacterium 4572_88]|nr:MAG: protein MltB [Desulfobacteraceae bacterium 4572_88]RLC15672.1 MAG: protein MltB [Deltaproteobacteria bacterium]
MFHLKNHGTEQILFLICVVLAACFFPAHAAAQTGSADAYFGSLQQRLIADGFDESGVRKLYGSGQAHFDTKNVSLYFVHRESKLNYGQFLKRGPLERARLYMKTHNAELAAAEKNYGVDKRVITAILLVETKLGTYVGRSSVLNILSTMSALADMDVREMLWKKIAASTSLSKQAFEEKSGKKSAWAYKELTAFLRYTYAENISPLNIYGSYAGAMGICQFMPSNILPLAKDGNGDGRIDLFAHADAIMSVANYLKHYGWRSGMDSKMAYEVVYHYNHSKYYVNTILAIAERLKG